MAKLHDWSRIYWRNASGSREFFRRTNVEELDDEDRDDYNQIVREEDRALYQNENGDIVGYRVADPPEPEVPEDAEAEEGEEPEPVMPDDWHGKKYEVFFQWNDSSERSIIEDTVFDEDPQGWVDEEEEREAEVDLAVFDTRGDARKFTAAWRAEHGSPEDLGYVNLEADDLPEDYDELQDLAAELGIKQNQSEEKLRNQLSGEEEPEFVNGHARVEAQ